MIKALIVQHLPIHKWHSHLVIAFGVGAFLGLVSSVFSPELMMIVMVIGCYSFAFLKRPEISLLVILIATSSIIFENSLPIIHVGFGSLHIPDILLLTSFGLIILRWIVEPDFKIVRTPLDIPLLAYFSVALISTFIALYQSSVEPEVARRSIRIVSYYLTFFIVTNLVRERGQLRLLLNGISFLGTFIALAMIAQYAIGEAISLLPGRVETLITQNKAYGGITRILPPGQSLILLSLITSIAATILDKISSFKIWRIIQIGLLGVAVIITFNRSYWVMVFIALIVLAYIIRGEHRQKFVVTGAIILLLLVILVSFILAEPESPIARLLTAYFERLATLGNAETLEEGSLQFRYVENEYAISSILSHPFLGTGLGSQYRPFDSRIDQIGSEWGARSYIHNGHFWIMLNSGLLGYFFFACLSIAFLIRSLRYWRFISDTQAKSAVLGSALTYLGVLIGAIVNPMFMQWFWIPVIGIMMGINEVVFRGMDLNSLIIQNPRG